MNRVYKIEVEVTVEVPEGIEPEEDDWESMAASAVTQFHERDCSPAGHNVVWARISAERFQVNGWDAETENYICTLETDNAHFAIAEMIRLGREGV